MTLQSYDSRMPLHYRLMAILLAFSALQSGAIGYQVSNYAWDPGPNTARDSGITGPGGATWSAVPSGVGSTLHQGLSTDIEFLVTPAVDGLEYALFDAAFDTWAAASGVTNLGKVDDGALSSPSAVVGAPESSNGHVGDIRVSAFDIDGRGGALAINRYPGTEVVGPDGTLGGDIFFDTSEPWIDDPNYTIEAFDFFTIALHQLGHALGLEHTEDPNTLAVMSPFYFDTLRGLRADDIAGIRAIYGVPEPSAWLLVVLAGMIAASRRCHKD